VQLAYEEARSYRDLAARSGRSSAGMTDQVRTVASLRPRMSNSGSLGGEGDSLADEGVDPRVVRLGRLDAALRHGRPRGRDRG
jgi:hypothetical protein